MNNGQHEQQSIELLTNWFIIVFIQLGITTGEKMGHYKIQCEDLKTFIKMVSGLMKEGACFESNADRLTIELTGGY